MYRHVPTLHVFHVTPLYPRHFVAATYRYSCINLHLHLSEKSKILKGLLLENKTQLY